LVFASTINFFVGFATVASWQGSLAGFSIEAKVTEPVGLCTMGSSLATSSLNSGNKRLRQN
jgi:hypothetical protein